MSSQMTKYLIRDENSTTAFLAMLFDRELSHSFQAELYTKFSEMTQIPLPPEGPRIRLEFQGIDLLFVWGEWIIAIENKISSQSITKNQLSKYYRKIKKIIDKNPKEIGCNIDAPVAIIYLTPSDLIGLEEFNRLSIDENGKDKKIKLGWGSLLDALIPIISNLDDNHIIRTGVDEIRRLLVSRKSNKVEDTQERLSIKSSLERIENNIKALCPNEKFVNWEWWRDRTMDQIFGSLEGNSTNVYLNIYCPESTIADNYARFHVRLEVKIAAKAKSKYQTMMFSRDLKSWQDIIGFEDLTLESEEDKSRLYYEDFIEGDISEVEYKLSIYYVRLLLLFRNYME